MPLRIQPSQLPRQGLVGMAGGLQNNRRSPWSAQRATSTTYNLVASTTRPAPVGTPAEAVT